MSFTLHVYDHFLVSFCECSSLILLSNVSNIVWNLFFINVFVNLVLWENSVCKAATKVSSGIVTWIFLKLSFFYYAFDITVYVAMCKCCHDWTCVTNNSTIFLFYNYHLQVGRRVFATTVFKSVPIKIHFISWMHISTNLFVKSNSSSLLVFAITVTSVVLIILFDLN